MDKGKLKKLSPKYLTENDLWDSSWLRKKYPDRFDNEYQRSEIGDDAIYDPALYDNL
tara:strand:+ start:469 stop:639 length:171 start_codon:yes stop_codon:yes gene_type:complete